MLPSLDAIWVILCAILVSTMQAGFCCLESGLVRAKNSINVASELPRPQGDGASQLNSNRLYG